MAITNSITAQQVGVGIAGPGQPGLLSATSKPTTTSATTVTTVALTIGILRGKIRVKVSTVDSTTSVASITVSVTDSDVSPKSYTVGSFNPPTADRVTGQQVEFVQEFVVDPQAAADTIVTATAKVTGAGSIGGTIAYFIDVELCGA